MGKRVFLCGTINFQVPDIVREYDCECSVWVNGVTMVIDGKEAKFNFEDPICHAVGVLNQINCSFRSEPISKKTWESKGLKYRSIKTSWCDQRIDKIIELDLQFCFRNPKTGEWVKWSAKEVASEVPFHLYILEIQYCLDAKILNSTYASKQVIEQYICSLRS